MARFQENSREANDNVWTLSMWQCFNWRHLCFSSFSSFVSKNLRMHSKVAQQTTRIYSSQRQLVSLEFLIVRKATTSNRIVMTSSGLRIQPVDFSCSFESFNQFFPSIDYRKNRRTVNLSGPSDSSKIGGIESSSSNEVCLVNRRVCKTWRPQ